MTDPTLTGQFVAGINDEIRAVLVNPLRRTDDGLTGNVAYNLTRMINEQGWTLDQAIHEASRDHETSGNVGAVITDRFKVAATIPPPKVKPAAKRHTDLAITHAAGECCDGYGWIYDETVDPPKAIKCHGIVASAS